MAVTTTVLAVLSFLDLVSCTLYYSSPNTYAPSCVQYTSNAWKDQCCFNNQFATYGYTYGNLDGFCPQRGIEGQSMCPESTIYMGIVESHDLNMIVQYTGDPKCKGELYSFTYRCCPCFNSATSTAPWPNDDPAARCVGCSSSPETLVGNNATGFSCSTPCSGGKSKKQRRGCPVTPSPTPTTTPVPNGNCKTATAGVEMLKSIEQFRAKFYNAGEGDVTIGYGHDCTQNKDCSSFHPPLTKAQATTQFQKDLSSFEKCTGKLPNAALLNTNQFSALVSFSFQSGCGGLSQCFKPYMAKKDFAGIAAALPTANLPSDKSLLQGIKNRRKKEQALFKTATGVMSGC